MMPARQTGKALAFSTSRMQQNYTIKETRPDFTAVGSVGAQRSVENDRADALEKRVDRERVREGSVCAELHEFVM